MANSAANQSELEWSWVDARQRERQVDTLVKSVKKLAHPTTGLRASVVWTAGAAGFSSSHQVLAKEFEAFRDVCSLASNLRTHPLVTDCSIHVMSSAGGLFEGQCRVDHSSVPIPQRPYGKSKLRQEAYLENLHSDIRKFVYRPSSVYGFATGARMGLVATLIRNASLRQSTKVFGSITTLRDFVFVDDIACFIASRIIFDRPHGTFTLASGKPTSLGEILAIVRQIVSSDLLIEVDPNPYNSSDNTFKPAILPSDFIVTDLKTGVILTERRLVRDELLDK